MFPNNLLENQEAFQILNLAFIMIAEEKLCYLWWFFVSCDCTLGSVDSKSRMETLDQGLKDTKAILNLFKDSNKDIRTILTAV